MKLLMSFQHLNNTVGYFVHHCTTVNVTFFSYIFSLKVTPFFTFNEKMFKHCSCFSWSYQMPSFTKMTRNDGVLLIYRIISVHLMASCSSISLSLYWFLSIRTLAISTLVKRFLCAVGTSLCGNNVSRAALNQYSM